MFNADAEIAAPEEEEDRESYYVKKGHHIGDYLKAMWGSMQDGKEMPPEVALNCMIAFVHSKRERGLW